MKDLLIQTAKWTDLIDAEQLAKFLKENRGHERLDKLLLGCLYFTKDMVLKLFAEALGYAKRISDQNHVAFEKHTGNFTTTGIFPDLNEEQRTRRRYLRRGDVGRCASRQRNFNGRLGCSKQKTL